MLLPPKLMTMFSFSAPLPKSMRRSLLPELLRERFTHAETVSPSAPPTGCRGVGASMDCDVPSNDMHSMAHVLKLRPRCTAISDEGLRGRLPGTASDAAPPSPKRGVRMTLLT